MRNERNYHIYIRKVFDSIMVYAYTQEEYKEVVDIFLSIGYETPSITLDMSKCYCATFGLHSNGDKCVFRNSYRTKRSFDNGKWERKKYKILTPKKLRKRAKDLHKEYEAVKMGLL